MPLNVKLFNAVSNVVDHPTITLTVDAGYKILGGGALDLWTGVGNLLTASYPSSATTWVVAGKDHGAVSKAAIQAYALAIYDPDDEWDVNITQATSTMAAWPVVVANPPAGYITTGGGACVNYGTGYGNLLTASCPTESGGWYASSKDHQKSDPATITSYVIGIRSADGSETLTSTLSAAATTVAEPYPWMTTQLDPDWVLTGGGARDNWTGQGNLLTGSYPISNGWVGSVKEHLVSSPATIEVFAIGIRIV